MRVFVAGASGAIGRRLVPSLVEAGHDVTGMTRSADKPEALRAAGAEPVVCDAGDAGAVRDAVARAKRGVVVHQLTAIPPAFNPRRMAEEFAPTNRLRTDGTRHLLDAAAAAGARRVVAQSVAFAYAPTDGWVKTEDDELFLDAPEAFRSTVEAIHTLETAVLGAGDLEGVVLRYGFFYGLGTPAVVLAPGLRQRARLGWPRWSRSRSRRSGGRRWRRAGPRRRVRGRRGRGTDDGQHLARARDPRRRPRGGPGGARLARAHRADGGPAGKRGRRGHTAHGEAGPRRARLRSRRQPCQLSVCVLTKPGYTFGGAPQRRVERFAWQRTEHSCGFWTLIQSSATASTTRIARLRAATPLPRSSRSTRARGPRRWSRRTTAPRSGCSSSTGWWCTSCGSAAAPARSCSARGVGCGRGTSTAPSRFPGGVRPGACSNRPASRCSTAASRRSRAAGRRSPT